MVSRSLGLKRPPIDPALAGRVPPGQHVTSRWPVLHQGEVPDFDPATWDFAAFGLVARPLRFSWAEFTALPRVTVNADMHCVTRWSKLDNVWDGVPLRAIINLVSPGPLARYVMFWCDGGYSANLPLAAVEADDALLALAHNGAALIPEHGFPLRVVVPQRYAWKSAKWVRAIEFTADDRAGYWERYGYHGDGDPWREQRFAE